MYLGAVYEREKEELKTLLARKPLAVIFDETPDVEGRCFLNILLAPLEKDHSGRILAYLADTVFLEQCNHSTVSVEGAYKNTAFRKPFVQLNSFMLSFSQMFFNAGSRKRKYLCFVTNKLARKKVVMPPNPCATRWNSWFSAVQYHTQHFGLYKEFIEMEIEVCSRSVPQSVERLHEMLQDPDLAQSLNVQINIMADKCKSFISLLDIFQSRHPVTTKIFTYLEDLQLVFAANKELQYEARAEYFEGFDLPHTTKTQILCIVGQAYENAEESSPNDSVASYKAIPGFTEVQSDEFDSYFKTLGPAAFRAAPSGVVDLDVFWDGLQERLPVLSSLAKRYKDAVSNSADAERSNSI
ncbi:hypothetical protein EPR50_G00124200 [Perca flavescens]|uniref:HAT C-terminal dimerisation domain-containing protein n=1 Tax=Perca flavescens TaxID=8167 RepID=A0A484CTP2_PERFV|nr:hypothetical protein EPR50_G00124200 [Perca flavescens]